MGTALCALQPSNNIRPKPVRIFEFRLIPLRSPLLRESHSISFPQGTKMFQFPWCPPAYAGAWVLPMRVTPLGNPRLGLLDSSPRLFAVMPRPSSATDAKASTLRPFLFDLLQLEHKTGHATLVASLLPFSFIHYSLFNVHPLLTLRAVLLVPLFKVSQSQKPIIAAISACCQYNQPAPRSQSPPAAPKILY